MNEITIIQPKQLNTIGALVTTEKFLQILDEPMRIPIIMPEANQQSLVDAGITIFKSDILNLAPEKQNITLTELAQVYALVFAGEPWNEVSKCQTTGNFFLRSQESCALVVTKRQDKHIL